MPAWAYLSGGLCAHHRPPATCIDCAVQVERTRVLMLLDEVEQFETGELLQALRSAITCGSATLGLCENEP